MKIILYLVIVVGCTYIGSMFSKKYGVRLQFYKELDSFINILQNQIKFKKVNIKTVVSENVVGFKTNLKPLLNNYFVDEKPMVKPDFVLPSENVFIENFFKSVGKMNVDGELANLNFQKNELNNIIAKCDEDNKKYGTLGTKLGLIAGLLLVVVLI